LGLLEEPDDLFLCEFALPHVRHSPGWRTPATSGWYGWKGAGHTYFSISLWRCFRRLANLL
ncbi:MAG: hypothetical protein ACKVOX_13755, partial [Rhizobacter sp.]